jgi:multicomponent Na+:H+ antiporter subunit B
MFLGGAALQNVLPLGQLGALFSGGTIMLLNVTVGIAVAAGFALVFLEFLAQTRKTDEEI